MFTWHTKTFKSKFLFLDLSSPSFDPFIILLTNRFSFFWIELIVWSIDLINWRRWSDGLNKTVVEKAVVECRTVCQETLVCLEIVCSIWFVFGVLLVVFVVQFEGIAENVCWWMPKHFLATWRWKRVKTHVAYLRFDWSIGLVWWVHWWRWSNLVEFICHYFDHWMNCLSL